MHCKDLDTKRVRVGKASTAPPKRTIVECEDTRVETM